MRMRTPRCPYCGAKLNYAKAWTLKRRGEYICPKCGGLANVRLDPLLYRLGVLAVLAGAGFFVAGWLSSSAGSVVWTVPGVVLPTVLFFLVSVFFVRLKKPAPARVQRAPAPRQRYSVQPPAGVSENSPAGADDFVSPHRTAGRGRGSAPPPR